MKRKIAAIMAADIAGYSKLVAEDEEETLRRLESYRAVFDDFMTRFSGRIFNAAGDSILAEFPSAVEAVRCAIDVQESLRTRNFAYPPSRQMNFRIGITIGDVVDRDGDLLGDGVNVAARLEGLAQPGGLCVSRAVYEQVLNKLSVEFVDIGEQELKNIPTRIHAYTLAIGVANERAPAGARSGKSPVRARRLWPIVSAAAAVGALGVAAFLLLGGPRPGATPEPAGTIGVTPGALAQSVPAQPPERIAETLVPETVPFVADRQREAIRTDYMPAPDHKALAISAQLARFATDQKDDETAKIAALAACQRATDTILANRPCELYAVGNTVVFARGRPPMPPLPWLVDDPAIETPFAINDIPLVREDGKALLAKTYLTRPKSKALAVGPHGGMGFYTRNASPEEAVRRALEWCGGNAGIPCMIVAVDDVFVVPIPTTMKVVGFFRAASDGAIAAAARDDVARRIGNATNSWNAVAVGAAGQPGLMLKATNEQSAVDGALADCGKRDRSCRVIAIGPFAVEPK
jgi:class 3 adenylate cyclase